MFDFLHFLGKSGLRRPSVAIRRALEADGLPPGTDLSSLGTVASRGNYSGREVTFFRLFDPKRAAGRAVDVFTDYAYQDLNAHLDLVLRAGFIEQDGTVVLFARTRAVDAPPARARADRSAHPDDERLAPGWRGLDRLASRTDPSAVGPRPSDRGDPRSAEEQRPC